MHFTNRSAMDSYTGAQGHVEDRSHFLSGLLSTLATWILDEHLPPSLLMSLFDCYFSTMEFLSNTARVAHARTNNFYIMEKLPIKLG